MTTHVCICELFKNITWSDIQFPKKLFFFSSLMTASVIKQITQYSRIWILNFVFSGGFTAIVKTCSNSKICAAAAASASVDSNGNGLQVTCCSSYLCNYSGAASVTLHRWLLVLPLLLITLLFRQHIWNVKLSGYGWTASHCGLKLCSYC